MLSNMNFAILIGASTVLTLTGLAIRRKYEGIAPVGIAVIWLAVVVTVLAFFVVPAAYGIAVIVTLFAALLIAFPPVVIAASLLAGSFGDFITRATFDSSMVTPMPSDFSKARARAVEGDSEAALREYRKYFDREPDNPAPLFAAALYMEKEARPKDAVPFYQEIMRRFNKHRIIWSEAALRLSAVYEHSLKEPKTAERILRMVMTRARGLEQARLACSRLMYRHTAEQGNSEQHRGTTSSSR